MKLTRELDLQLQCRTPQLPYFFAGTTGKTKSKRSTKSALNVVNFNQVKQKQQKRVQLSAFVCEQSEASWQALSGERFDAGCDLDVQLLTDDVLSALESSVQLVLIQLTKLNDKKTYQLVDTLRRQGCYVILAGQAVSSAPEQAQKHADCIFVGDEKRNLKQFLADYHNKDLRRFYYSPSQQVDITASDEKAKHASVPLIASPVCSH